ncbi:uncharacterized protein LOC136038734 [Artemia franciscana]|uniref:Uncharacterized protein n=1 Tax=Artemia franciscana TaxID=6661 RepID=A0AA88I0C1_ARTSF|nr:hypothetical protein QYM36_006420 [Artemia franciscana]
MVSYILCISWGWLYLALTLTQLITAAPQRSGFVPPTTYRPRIGDARHIGQIALKKQNDVTRGSPPPDFLNRFEGPRSSVRPSIISHPKRQFRPGFAKVSLIETGTDSPIHQDRPFIPPQAFNQLTTETPLLLATPVTVPPKVESSTKKVQLLSDAGKPGSPYELIHRIFPPESITRSPEEEEKVLNSLQQEDLNGLRPDEVYLAEKDLFVIRGAGFPSTYEETKTEEPISDYQAPAPVPPPAPEPGTLLFTIQNGVDNRIPNQSPPFNGGGSLPFPFPPFLEFGRPAMNGTIQPFYQGPNIIPFPGNLPSKETFPNVAFQPGFNPAPEKIITSLPLNSLTEKHPVNVKNTLPDSQPFIVPSFGLQSERPLHEKPPLPENEKFIARPPLNPISESDEDYEDEVPPPLFPPRDVEFYYPNHNATEVPPGPAGPGIFVPPPLNFFQQSNDTRHKELLQKVHEAKIFMPPPWTSGFIPMNLNEPIFELRHPDGFKPPAFRELVDDSVAKGEEQDNIDEEIFPFSHEFLLGKDPGKNELHKFSENQIEEVSRPSLKPSASPFLDKTKPNNNENVPTELLISPPSFSSLPMSGMRPGNKLGSDVAVINPFVESGRKGPFQQLKEDFPQAEKSPSDFQGNRRIDEGSSIEEGIFHPMVFSHSNVALEDKNQNGLLNFLSDGLSPSNKLENSLFVDGSLSPQLNENESLEVVDGINPRSFDGNLDQHVNPDEEFSGKTVELTEQLPLFPAKQAFEAEFSIPTENTVVQDIQGESKGLLGPVPHDIGEEILLKMKITNESPKTKNIESLNFNFVSPSTDSGKSDAASVQLIDGTEFRDEIIDPGDNIHEIGSIEIKPFSPRELQTQDREQYQSIESPKGLKLYDIEIENGPIEIGLVEKPYISQFQDLLTETKDSVPQTSLLSNFKERTDFSEEQDYPLKDIFSSNQKYSDPSGKLETFPKLDTEKVLDVVTEKDLRPISDKKQHHLEKPFDNLSSLEEEKFVSPIDKPKAINALNIGSFTEKQQLDISLSENGEILNQHQLNNAEIDLKQDELVPPLNIFRATENPISSVGMSTEILNPDSHILVKEFRDSVSGDKPFNSVHNDAFLLPKDESDIHSSRNGDSNIVIIDGVKPIEIPVHFNHPGTPIERKEIITTSAEIVNKSEAHGSILNNEKLQNYYTVPSLPVKPPESSNGFGANLNLSGFSTAEVDNNPSGLNAEILSPIPINDGEFSNIGDNPHNLVPTSSPISLESDIDVNFKPPFPEKEKESEIVPLKASVETQTIFTYPFTFFRTSDVKVPGSFFKFETRPNQKSYVSVSHFGPSGIGYSYSY